MAELGLQVRDLVQSVGCHAPELRRLRYVRVLYAQALEPGDRHGQLFVTQGPRLERVAARTDPEDVMAAATTDLEKQTTAEAERDAHRERSGAKGAPD